MCLAETNAGRQGGDPPLGQGWEATLPPLQPKLLATLAIFLLCACYAPAMGERLSVTHLPMHIIGETEKKRSWQD
jgi:hypothetical protein